MDRQGEAYRQATEADWAGVRLDECVIYPDGDQRPIRRPEDWESSEWDAGREAPKAPDQARAALAARIADPTAPDEESMAGAYDHLEA